MILSSHFGIHQACLPSMSMTAGMRIMRTRNASRKTAVASDTPIVLMSALSCEANAANTEIMMSAAATTTRPEWRKPSMTASRASMPWAYASRMRVVRKTW